MSPRKGKTGTCPRHSALRGGGPQGSVTDIPFIVVVSSYCVNRTQAHTPSGRAPRGVELYTAAAAKSAARGIRPVRAAPDQALARAGLASRDQVTTKVPRRMNPNGAGQSGLRSAAAASGGTCSHPRRRREAQHGREPALRRRRRRLQAGGEGVERGAAGVGGGERRQVAGRVDGGVLEQAAAGAEVAGEGQGAAIRGAAERLVVLRRRDRLDRVLDLPPSPPFKP